MFRYFWLEGSDLAQYNNTIGFGLFTWKHYAMLAVCAALITALCLYFQGRTAREQNKILRITAVALLLGNIGRDIFLLARGRMTIAYLPLHLCSFAIFVYLLHAFLPEDYGIARASIGNSGWHHKTAIEQSRFRQALGEIGFTLLMTGTICALILPDWSAYPIWNFMSLHSFLWHAVLVAYPLMLLISGRIHPTIRHIWYPIANHLVVDPPTYAFDIRMHCNYLYVNWPLPGTPLEWLSLTLGKYWRLGYVALVLMVILAEYGIIHLTRTIRTHIGGIPDRYN